MDNCYSCQNTDENNLIFKTKYWKVFLHEEQSYLGRSVVVLKRHSPNLSDLSAGEWNDLHELIKKTESLFQKTFGSRLLNWTCLMNDAYQNNPPNPHVHWHIRPRYAHEVIFSGKTFEDPDFGHHYNRDRKEKVSLETQQLIIKKIKENL